MKTKITVLTLCAMLLALCPSASAQQSKKVPRIGYLSSNEPATTESTRSEGIRLALRERGHIERQNITIEYRYAEGKLDRLPELATELMSLKVDVIVVAAGDLVVRAAKNATKTIPIVMTGVGSDPVNAGFVESLARPGSNITGLTAFGTELGGKRLELLKEAVPKLARVAILYDPAIPSAVRDVKGVQTAALELKLTVQPWEVRGTEELGRVFAAMGKQRADGIYVPSAGPFMRANEKRIVGFALKSRLPSMCNNRAAVEAGGLMSYTADTLDAYRRVAWFVDKILKGAKPAELPVEQAMKFEFVINLKTANQIGLTIPQSVLYRADKVIK